MVLLPRRTSDRSAVVPPHTTILMVPVDITVSAGRTGVVSMIGRIVRRFRVRLWHPITVVTRAGHSIATILIVAVSVSLVRFRRGVEAPSVVDKIPPGFAGRIIPAMVLIVVVVLIRLGVAGMMKWGRVVRWSISICRFHWSPSALSLRLAEPGRRYATAAHGVARRVSRDHR